MKKDVLDNTKNLIIRNSESIRRQFPALRRPGRNGRPCIFFDAPAGTQAPQVVIDAMSDYFILRNANTHGQFITSMESDKMIEQARVAAADFLGASGADAIPFGANMSTMAFHLSRAIAS